MAEEDVKLSILMDESALQQLERAAQALEKTGERWGRSAASWRSATGGMSSAAQGAGMGSGQEAEDEARRKRFGAQLAGINAPIVMDMATRAEMARRERDSAERGQQKKPSYNDQFAKFNRNLSSGLQGGELGQNLSQLGNTLGDTFRKLATVINAASDSTLTLAQRQQGLIESLPIVGSFASGLREFGEAIRGVTNDLNLNRLRAESAGLLSSTSLSNQSQAGGMRIESARLAGTAAEHRRQADMGFAGLGVADPKNVFDPLERQRFQRETGIAQHRQGLEADAAGLAAQGKAIDAEERRLTGQRDNAKRVHDESLAQAKLLQGKEREKSASSGGLGWLVGNNSVNLAGRPHKAEIDDSGRSALQASKDLLTLEEQLREAQNRRHQHAEAVARNQHEQAKALVDLERSRLEILRSQGEIISGQTQSFGSLTRARQSLVTSTLQQAKDRGFDSLTMGQRNIIREGGFGQVVQRGIEKQIEGNPLFRQAQGLAADMGASPRGTLGENLTAQTAAQKLLVEATKKSEAAFATGVSTSFDKFLKGVEDVLRRILEAKLKELDGRRLVERNLRI